MPEEADFNRPPAGPNMNQSSSYPQEEKKDDSFSDPSPSHTQPPPKPPVTHSSPPRRETFDEFSQNQSSPVPNILVWLAFALVLIATGFFWLSDYSNVKAISEKESEKNAVLGQLNSADNKKIETEATNFKNSFQQLSTLVTKKVSKADFLNQLYTHLTRDVKITSISVSSENELGLDGATGSYRQVADLMLGMKGFDKLSEVSLKNVAVSTEDGVPSNQKIVFSITAKVNFDTGAIDTSSSNATTGTSTTSP